MPDNLLIIMSDEHQARAMGCANHPFVQTPNLDKLAQRGLRFTNAYTPSPICVPARAAFATGRYVHQNRLWDNAMPYTGSIPGWGHALQNAEVPVESIGKLHYRNVNDPAGFDHEHIPMMVVDGVGMVWASIRHENERIHGKKRMLGDYIGPGTSSYTNYDTAVTEHAKKWFAARAKELKQPWCLFVGLVAPHFPFVVPQEFYDLYPTDTLPEVKLHPDTGYQRHPWVEKQNAMMDSESKFQSADERLSAMACYYGLCSWMDHNIGVLLDALQNEGLLDTTTVVYTSDHGDNVGARGLWGKSNMYEESSAIPMIVAGNGIEPGHCDTPVSLLDLSVTICDHFNQQITYDGVEDKPVGENLLALAQKQKHNQTYDSNRVVFSEYHAAGAVTGAYMIRKGEWKYIHYEGFEPELFNLVNDPEELVNLASQSEYSAIATELRTELYKICDPAKINALAHGDQTALIERLGGREEALKLGAPGATPPPGASG